jgi:hypothetical protein
LRSARVSRAGERVFADGLPGSFPRRASTKLKKSSFRRDAETSTPEVRHPIAVGGTSAAHGSLRVVDFVAAVERAYPYPLNPLRFD